MKWKEETTETIIGVARKEIVSIKKIQGKCRKNNDIVIIGNFKIKYIIDFINFNSFI